MSNNTEKELLLRLHDKVDGINDNLKEIAIIQTRHESSLNEHIRRTDIAEARIELIENEVKPVLQGLSFLKVLAKVGATLASLFYAVLKFFQ